MNINDLYLRSNSICVGCLSSERELTRINSAEVSTIFCEILNSLDGTSITLCWECKAITKKFIKFRRRVKIAKDYLLQCVLNNTKPPKLSNFIVTKTQIVEFSNIHKEKDKVPYDTQSLILKPESYRLENGDQSPYTMCPNNTQSKTIQISQNYILNESHKSLETGDKAPYFLDESDDTDVKASQSDGINHLSFIKIEDEEINDIGDESVHYEDVGNDDKDFKSELKEEPDMVLVNVKKSVHLINNKDGEHFNESDDEPLNTKRKRKKGHNKRIKDKNGISGKFLNTQVGKRREQLAGVVHHPRVERILKQLHVDPTQMEMVVLDWEEIEAERVKALNNESFTRHKYKCHDCVLGFNHKFKLDNHMKKHDESSGKVVCSICKIRCKDDGALRAHKRRHRLRWRCCVCGDLSSRAPVAADHVTRTHGAPPPTHICKICGHKESSLGKLRSHTKNHGERPKCDICKKTFRDRASLRTHLFIHKGEKEYSCPECGKRFLFKKAMEVHLVTHDASAHLYCQPCDMNFKNRMSYNQHIKYNLKHIDPSKLKYACDLCDKRFSKPKRLEEHNMAVHLNAKPINCTIQGCLFTCSSRSALRTHLRMVHRNARAQRNHVCHTCGKAYTTKNSLEGHMRSHSGERPFKCSLCPSTFGYEAALYNHNKLVHLKNKIGRNASSYSQHNKESEK